MKKVILFEYESNNTTYYKYLIYIFKENAVLLYIIIRKIPIKKIPTKNALELSGIKPFIFPNTELGERDYNKNVILPRVKKYF